MELLLSSAIFMIFALSLWFSLPGRFVSLAFARVNSFALVVATAKNFFLPAFITSGPRHYTRRRRTRLQATRDKQTSNTCSSDETLQGYIQRRILAVEQQCGQSAPTTKSPTPQAGQMASLRGRRILGRPSFIQCFLERPDKESQDCTEKRKLASCAGLPACSEHGGCRARGGEELSVRQDAFGELSHRAFSSISGYVWCQRHKKTRSSAVALKKNFELKRAFVNCQFRPPGLWRT